jgi:hypothetical protein
MTDAKAAELRERKSRRELRFTLRFILRQSFAFEAAVNAISARFSSASEEVADGFFEGVD